MSCAGVYDMTVLELEHKNHDAEYLQRRSTVAAGYFNEERPCSFTKDVEGFVDD